MSSMNKSREQERRRLKSLTISRMVYAAKQRNNEMATKLKKKCDDSYEQLLKDLKDISL